MSPTRRTTNPPLFLRRTDERAAAARRPTADPDPEREHDRRRVRRLRPVRRGGPDPGPRPGRDRPGRRLPGGVRRLPGRLGDHAEVVTRTYRDSDRVITWLAARWKPLTTASSVSCLSRAIVCSNSALSASVFGLSR